MERTPLPVEPMTAVVQLAVLTAVLACVVIWAGGFATLAPAVDGSCPDIGTDFLRYYHPAAAWGRAVPGYVYPPTLALLLTPLGRLSPLDANAVWTTFQLLAFASLAIVPPHLVTGTPRVVAVLYTALATSSVPLLQNLVWGQVSTPLALLGLVAFSSRASSSMRRAGAFGLAIAVKTYPALWLSWPAVRGDWKTLAGAAGLAAALALVLPAALLGPEAALAFYREVQENLAGLLAFLQRNPGPQYLPLVLSRRFGAEYHVAFTAASWLSALGLLVTLRTVARQATPDRELCAYVLAGGLFAFLVRTSWLNYFTHLPIAWLILGRRLRTSSAPIPLGLALAASVLLGTIPWQIVVTGGSARAYAAGGWLAASNVLALLGVTWTTFRPASAPRT